jgi:hypothetical protein
VSAYAPHGYEGHKLQLVEKDKTMQGKLTFESAGLNGFVKDVPETAAEFDTLAGKVGACLEFAKNYVMFHRVLGSFRADLMKAVAEDSEITPKTEPHPKDKDKVVIVEKPVPYIERVCAERKVDVTTYQPIADAICDGDGKEDNGYLFKDFLVATARGEGGPAIGKQDLEDARTLIAQGPDKLATSLKKIVKVTGAPITLTGDADKDVKIVALSIKAYRKAMTKTLIV